MLGGIIADMDVFGRNAKRQLAIFAKDASIVDGIGHFGSKTIVLVANDEGIGVVASEAGDGDERIDIGSETVVVDIGSTIGDKVLNGTL